MGDKGGGGGVLDIVTLNNELRTTGNQKEWESVWKMGTWPPPSREGGGWEETEGRVFLLNPSSETCSL